MHFANIFFTAVCGLCALIFGSVALWAYKSRDPVAFWSGSSVSHDEITDVPAYNRANGRMWAVFTATLALSGALSLFSVPAGAALLFCVCLPGFGVLIYFYTRIYKKYLREGAPNRNNSSKAAARAGAIAAAVITLIVCGAVAALLFTGTGDADVRVTGSSMQIKGLYGTSVAFSEIERVTLIESSMAQLGAVWRTNGFGGFGQSLKGNFRSDTLGDILLFVQSKSAPTIKIERGAGRDIYISLRDGGATRRLFVQLELALK